MSSSLLKSGTQVNVKVCRKKGEANHIETPHRHLHKSPYPKIIEFCVVPAVSSIKLSEKMVL